MFRIFWKLLSTISQSRKEAGGPSLNHILYSYIPLLSWNPGPVTPNDFHHWNSWGPIQNDLCFLSKSSWKKSRSLKKLRGWKMTIWISIFSVLTQLTTIDSSGIDPQMRTSHAAAIERSVAARRNAPRRPGGGCFFWLRDAAGRLKHTIINW